MQYLSIFGHKCQSNKFDKLSDMLTTNKMNITS